MEELLKWKLGECDAVFLGSTLEWFVPYPTTPRFGGRESSVVRRYSDAEQRSYGS